MNDDLRQLYDRYITLYGHVVCDANNGDKSNFEVCLKLKMLIIGKNWHCDTDIRNRTRIAAVFLKDISHILRVLFSSYAINCGPSLFDNNELLLN